MLTKFLEKYFPDSFVTNFWTNPRKRALFLLPLWAIFIVYIFVYFVVPYKNSLENNTLVNETSNKKVYDLETLWNKLFESDYNFKYIKYIGEDSMITYEGKKTNNGASGTKNNGEEVVNFYIENGIIYIGDEEDSLEYGKLDEIEYDKYLDIKYVYEFIKDFKQSKEDTTYIYEKDGNCVIIFTVGDYINSIEIDLEESKYILNFMRVD